MSRIRDSIRKVRSASKRPKKTPKDSKIDRKVIPLTERERIAQMYMLGKNKSKLAAETGHTRKSVARIIKEADIPKYVEHVRGRFVGLGELAVETLEKRMKSGDWELAYRFLTDSGIIADVEGRAFASRVAAWIRQSTCSCLPDALQLILGSLSAEIAAFSACCTWCAKNRVRTGSRSLIRIFLVWSLLLLPSPRLMHAELDGFV